LTFGASLQFPDRAACVSLALEMALWRCASINSPIGQDLRLAVLALSQFFEEYSSRVSGERTGSASDVTQREFLSGQKLFGRYTLIRILGRGGMGIVSLARDEELERDVALKFLPDLIIHDAAVLSDLKRETKRCLELTHKNIVRIYDFVHDERSGCISMEYVDGDTLSSLRCAKERKSLKRTN